MASLHDNEMILDLIEVSVEESTQLANLYWWSCIFQANYPSGGLPLIKNEVSEIFINSYENAAFFISPYEDRVIGHPRIDFGHPSDLEAPRLKELFHATTHIDVKQESWISQHFPHGRLFLCST